MARTGLSLPPTRTLVTPYCKRTRPGRGTNTRAAGFPFTPVSLFPPSVLRLAPTHLGWGTRRQFPRRSRDPPGSKRRQDFCIVSVYVDDLNIIGYAEDIEEANACLKTEFEMKDLGETKFCLGLQIEHLLKGIFVHKSTYCKKVLEGFNMIKAHPLKTPMVVRSLEMETDPFRPKSDDEKSLGPEVPYLSAIGALMYLANCTRPDIAFAVNLLAR
jgi:hypothetical protein